jgi:mono/diheme cytochrome c family protein
MIGRERQPLLGATSVLFVAIVWSGGAVSLGADAPDYIRDVQPIFAKHCVRCHGPEIAQQDLRLDSIVGVSRGGNSGPSVLPGKAGESRLIDAVTTAKDAEAMPPKDELDPLSEAEVAILRQWVDAGATGPANAVEPPRKVPTTHWAFQPIDSPRPPAVASGDWCRNPIDRFILARLENEGLRPSPQAERPTLIRRLSLDLLGVPPSIHEVDEFVNNPSPDAYEELVERILSSPAYGERWGRHWLDQARYADSNGYTIDSARSMWKYRDWVIAAINADEPFDVFAEDQLAGDMVPNATQNQLIATGFHRNTLKNEEGGTDPEQFRVESVVDRVSTTGSVFLGLTVGCARCHDHKYDPISQREFYQLFAIFNSADEPTLDVPTDRQQAEEAP